MPYFLTAKGLAIKVLIPKCKSMNARFYKTKSLRKVVKFYQKYKSKTGICGVYLSHDNVEGEYFENFEINKNAIPPLVVI